jgi:hypothetical protein
LAYVHSPVMNEEKLRKENEIETKDERKREREKKEN